MTALIYPFLNLPAAAAVLAALAPHEVRFVGGCVRDALTGRAVTDIDLATPLPPGQVMAQLRTAGLKVAPTGLGHGTVTAVVNGQPFEITTLRRDVTTDGRHAEVAFTDSWREDAARRDFTINAMSMSPDGVLHDYSGGAADLAAGRVRFVGQAETRIREDHLRILRFFRFTAHFGQDDPDAEGLAACRDLAPLLPTLAYERVRNELLKLLAAYDPVSVWRLMGTAGVLDALNLPLANSARLAMVVATETALRRPDPLRRLWAVADTGANIQQLARQLRLSRPQATRLAAIGAVPFLPDDLAGLRRLVYRHGLSAVMDALIVRGAATAEQVHALDGWTPPTFPLTGAMLLKAGLKSGPDLGERLQATEQWWAAENFMPDQAACLKRALAFD